MSLDSVIAEYASRNRLGPLAPRPDGSYALVFDERYKVRLTAEGTHAAVIHGRIGDLPAATGELRDKLDALLNLATARMRAASEIVTVTEDAKELILFRRFSTTLAPHAVEAVLTAFVNSLAYWQRVHSATARPAMAAGPMGMLHRGGR